MTEELSLPPPTNPEAPTEQTLTGSYVQIGVETFITWICPSPLCAKRAKSTDPALVQALARGETPIIPCPSCKHEHPIAKPPEKLIHTPAELRKKGYNPNLSGAANRLLGNVRR